MTELSLIDEIEKNDLNSHKQILAPNHNSMKLFPYINFYGNARQALNLYKNIFDGTIERLNEYKDSPLANQSNSHLIIHSEIHFRGNIICMADMIAKEGQVQIKNQSNHQPYELCINFDAIELQNAKKIFKDLSENGQVLMNFELAFWQAYYGKVKDPFGIIWSLNCPAQEDKIQEIQRQETKKQDNQKLDNQKQTSHQKQ